MDRVGIIRNVFANFFTIVTKVSRRRKIEIDIILCSFWKKNLEDREKIYFPALKISRERENSKVCFFLINKTETSDRIAKTSVRNSITPFVCRPRLCVCRLFAKETTLTEQLRITVDRITFGRSCSLGSFDFHMGGNWENCQDD